MILNHSNEAKTAICTAATTKKKQCTIRCNDGSHPCGVQSLNKSETWRLVHHPRDRNFVPWYSIIRFQERVVARRFPQIEGIDYPDTFFSVVDSDILSRFTATTSAINPVLPPTSTSQLLHERLGHTSAERLRLLGVTYKPGNSKSCILAKQPRSPFPTIENKFNNKLDCVYCDHRGPFTPISLSNAILVDAKTRYLWIYCVPTNLQLQHSQSSNDGNQCSKPSRYNMKNSSNRQSKRV